MSGHDKYIVLKNRFVLEANFGFPKTIKHGCNCSYKTAYLSDSFVYSCRDNAIYCIYCVFFVSKRRLNILGAFVNRGYREWHSLMEKEKKHSQNTYHQEAITLALATIDRFEKPESTIPALNDNSIKESYETYSKVVHAISRVIHLIGKQGIALHGHREDLDDSKPDNNPGSFLSILTAVAHNCPVLQEHLEEPFRTDVTYLSPTNQNEMIDIIGKNIIQETLLDGVKKAGMHSVSADEVTSSSDEILSICVIYLDEFQNIREVLIGFLNFERITGEHIGEAILKFTVN